MWGTRGPLKIVCHFEPGVWNWWRRNRISGRAFAAPGRGSCIPARGFPVLFCFVFPFVLHPISPFSALPSALNLTVDSEAIFFFFNQGQNSRIVKSLSSDRTMTLAYGMREKKPIISVFSTQMEIRWKASQYTHLSWMSFGVSLWLPTVFSHMQIIKLYLWGCLHIKIPVRSAHLPSPKASLSSLFRSTGNSILSIYDWLLANLNLFKLITFISSCYFF